MTACLLLPVFQNYHFLLIVTIPFLHTFSKICRAGQSWKNVTYWQGIYRSTHGRLSALNGMTVVALSAYDCRVQVGG
jgi:hypothetical protein